MYEVVKTKTGEAVHVRRAGGPSRQTLCGRRAYFRLAYLDSLVQAGAIQHPWRCEVCNAAVARDTA